MSTVLDFAFREEREAYQDESSVNRAGDKFEENDPPVRSPREMLFECDGDNQTSWLGELNSIVQDIELKNRRNGFRSRKVKFMTQSHRCRRLVINLKTIGVPN